MKKRIHCMISLCVLMLLFTSCGESAMGDVNVSDLSAASNSVVEGASDTGRLSVGEAGIVHIKDGHLLFFDYKSKENYVICSRSNCRHDDESCSGWYDRNQGATGLGEYGGKLYCFIGRMEKNTYEFIQMDLDGNHRKVIAEISRGDSLPGKWEAELHSAGTYYADNKAITVINWMYNAADSSENTIQTQQCIAIDLKSGDITEITPREKEEIQCEVDATSTEYSLIEMSGYETPILSEKEFYKAYEEGTYQGNDTVMKADNPYEAYTEQYFDETGQWYRYILFDLQTQKSSVLKEGLFEILRDKDGKAHAVKPPFYTLGWYKGDLIIRNLEEGVIADEKDTGVIKDQIYRWNLKTDQKKQLMNIDNGYVFDAGGLDNTSIIEGDKLLFYKRTPDGKGDYYSYSLSTGKKDFLYKAERNVPYRIIGETEDKFIYYTFDDTKKYMYVMNKTDYFKGNFKDSLRLKALDEEF